MLWIRICVILIFVLIIDSVSNSEILVDSLIAKEKKTCEDCPAQEPCKIIVPKGDKCNTCVYEVHCSENKWYQSSNIKCSNLDCVNLIPIENPFSNDRDEKSEE